MLRLHGFFPDKREVPASGYGCYYPRVVSKLHSRQQESQCSNYFALKQVIALENCLLFVVFMDLYELAIELPRSTCKSGIYVAE